MAAQRKTPFPRLFLTRSEPFRLVGSDVFLRPPERADYEEWASLRARSRNFLTPWEPSWPPDALSRASFRSRLARYAEDWRTDQGYNFFIFREDETLTGGIGLSNVRRFPWISFPRTFTGTIRLKTCSAHTSRFRATAWSVARSAMCTIRLNRPLCRHCR